MQKKIIASILLCGLTFLDARAQDSSPTKTFANETEIGVIVQKGNVDSETILAKQMNEWTRSKNIYHIEAKHIRTKSGGDFTSRYFSLGVRYERQIVPKFGIFVGHAIEVDKPAELERRNSSDIGGKYRIEDSESFKWSFEGGYRYIDERLTTSENEYDHALRAYTEALAKLSATNALKYWFEYIPSLNHSKNYRINSEVSLIVTISDVFSTKMAYLINYANSPTDLSRKKADQTTTISLLSKF